LTKAAVIEYQRANGVTPVTGAIGDKTKAVLLGGVVPTPPTTTSQSSGSSVGSGTATGPFTKTLSYGITDPQVKTLQKFLAKNPAIYPQGLVTGYFGAATAQAVQHFQLAHSITVSQSNFGIVGPATRAVLNSLYLSGQKP